LPRVVPVVPNGNQVLSPTQAEMPLLWFQSVTHTRCPGIPMAFQPHLSWTQEQPSPCCTCKDLWDKLPPSKKQLEPWEGRPLVGVAGTSLDVYGSAVVEITIAGESFHNTVVVASALTSEAILGLISSNPITAHWRQVVRYYDLWRVEYLYVTWLLP